MATWAKGIDFKNSGNTARIGGIGVYGTDTTSEKIYIGLGAEPWNNTGLQLTASAIDFKGNKIYHAGDKPTPAEIGAATSSHTHNYAGSSSAGGSANSAVKLATTRKLTIGSTGKSFDGSADVNWSLSEIGAAAASHSHNYLPLSGGAVTSSNFGPLVIKRSGSTNASTIVFSNDNGTLGSIGMTASKNGGLIRWTDDTASNYTILDTGNYKSFVTPASIGAAAASHNHNVLISAGSRIASADIAAKGDRGLRMYLATSSMTTGKPAADGYILNFDWDTTAGWSSQMYIKNSNSPIMQIRGMNAGTWGSWYTLYSTNNKPTPAEIGAAASSHTHSYIPLSGSTGVTGTLRSNSEIQTTSQNAFRAVSGNYGFFIRNDGSNTWFMLTNSGDQYGSYNSLRPISINNSSGLVTFGNGLKGTLDGNASTATKLQTARTIALGGDASGSATFDGSANATISATVRKTCFVGSDVDGTSGWYKVASQTMSGYGNTNITFAVTSTYGYYNSGILQLQMRSDDTSISCKRLAWYSRMGLSPSHYIINVNGMTWTLYAYQPNSRYGRLMFEVLSQSSINNKNSGFTLYNSSTKESANPTATVTSSDGATVGYANSLASTRTLTIGNSGKSFNGTANVSWSLSEIGAAASSHTHNYAGSSSAGGAATTALACTGNSATATTSNYLASNSRMDYGWNGVNYFNISGTAGNAAKANDTPTSAWWHIMRFNHANNTGYYTDLAIPFNDTSLYYKRITAGSVQNGGWVKVLDSLNYNSYSPTKTGGGASGTWGISVSGNASTATKLQTARTINGTSFNGSANITTANWGTARTITVGSTAKSVNGSANIGWTLAEIGAVPSYTGGSTTIHADSDASSTSEYLLLKAGHNELKIASSAGGTTVTKGQDKLTFNGNIVYHAGRKPTASEIGAAASSHSHSYLPLSGGTITSNGFTIKTTTATDSSGYITFQDTSGKRRAYITSNSGSSGIKIHTYDSAGTWKSNFVIEEDGSVHIGNGYLKAISEIWGRESSINLNIKKGTGFQGGARFNWTGATNIGAPRFQMIPMDSYDLRVGSPENPIHVVYGRVGYVTTSDREAKTNIHYIDDMQPLGLTNKTSVDEVKTLTKDDFYNFFKDEIRFASYDFKEANLENLETNLGFMAQDIADTKVGSKIVIPPREKIEYYHEDGTITEEKVDNGMYSFSTTNFASATAIALQKAIEKIEILENQIALLNEKLGL
jgi:hypothetical protein